MIGRTRLQAHIPDVIAGLVVVLWLATACLWIDRPGLHYDETLFVSGAFPENPAGAVWKIDVLNRPVAVMMMSYMGALKGWIYGSLLAVFEPTAATIRLPLLLLAALTIAATYRLATELFDRMTGLVAMLLVATDPIFFLTSRMDWGPVVIQRLCLVMGAHLIFTGSSGQALHPRAVAGAFLFGVALFDKLTFIWIVFGLLAAFLLTYRKQLPSLLRYKLLPVCIAVLVLPMAPAIYFGAFIGSPAPTKLEQHYDHLTQRYGMLRYSLDGTVLRDPIVYQSADHPIAAVDTPTKILYWLDSLGSFSPGWFRPALTGALLLLPVTGLLPGGRRRLFLVLFCFFSLIPMILIEAAGSVHHITLIYPFPHIFVAASFVSIAGWMSKRMGQRPAMASLAAVSVLVAGSNAMNIVHEYAEMIRFGSRPIWSEAIYELSDFVNGSPPDLVLVGDWGIAHQLIFLSNNQLPVTRIPHAGPDNDEALEEAIDLLRQPNTILVRYAAYDLSPSPMQHDLVEQAALATGIRLELLTVIRDRQRRSVYNVYSLQRGGAP